MSTFPISDDTRSQDIDPDLVSTHAGKWIRGWTGASQWLNFGLVYDGQYLPTTGSFPHLTAYIRSIEASHGQIIMAGLSWLESGYTIPPHTDESISHKEDNVHHLGLIVPDLCGLITDGVHQWERVGKSIWFNDSETHSAYNKSTRDRVVLYVKV